MAQATVVFAIAVLWSLVAISAAANDHSPFPEPGQLTGRAAGATAVKKGKWNECVTEFGYVLVPEDRSDPSSRLLELPFIRQQALESNLSEPVFVLGGGPGVSNLWADLPAVFYARNDLVRVGYRGVDGAVKLVCPEVGLALAGERPLSPEGIARTRDALRKCYDSHVASGVDLDGYNMLEVVDDIEAVRVALGFDKINLFATSYGTQLAYIYCQRYQRTAHRTLMVGASNRSRRFVWEPEVVDRQLGKYANLWNADPEASARTPDITATIERVLESLPADWRGIPVDSDKLRLATFRLLYDTETAAAVLDAYVAAEKGDPSGLAVICLGYDEEVQSTSRRYWGDFFSKIMSGGFQRSCDASGVVRDRARPLGSPANEMWRAACMGGWPVEPVPEEYCSLVKIDTPMLVLNGMLDVSSPPEYALELEPFLSKGTIVLLPGMGHMDVVKVQREAFETAVAGFFVRGEVDTSGYRSDPVDLTPEETFQDHARELFKDPAPGED